MERLQKEPVVVIGLLVTIALGIVSTLLGEGFISEAQSGKITDAINALGQLAILAAPLIAAIIARGFVTPTAQPSLPTGTKVEVIQPGSEANTTAVL